MTSRPIPFQFGRDFKAADEPVQNAAPPTVTLADHKRLVSEADEAGFARGLTAGRDTTMQSQAARVADTSERLVSSVVEILGEMDARQRQYEREAVELAVALAQKLAGAALRRAPLAEIEAAAAECFAETRATPHVVVRVSTDMVEEVQDRLTTIASEKGFAGRLIVLGEPEISTGDCRFEWADGGIVRDAAVIEAAVTHAVNRYLHTLSGEQS